MTNFDFLKAEPKFAAFADVAISAEKILNIDISIKIMLKYLCNNIKKMEKMGENLIK